MRMRGLEPPQPCGYMDLNHARLPIPPHPHNSHKSATFGLICSCKSFKLLSMILEPESKESLPLTSKSAEFTGNTLADVRHDSQHSSESATNQPHGYVTKVCIGCGGEFRVRGSELRRGGGRGQYCSRSCRPSGASMTATRRRARDMWISRHHGAHPICRLCARKADIHHKDGDPLNNAPGNHDELCRSHHTAHENSAFPRRRVA